MKSRSSSSMGALHPVLFFAVMYVVVLFLSIFICSSIFHSLNDTETGVQTTQTQNLASGQNNMPLQVSSAVVVR